MEVAAVKLFDSLLLHYPFVQPFDQRGDTIAPMLRSPAEENDSRRCIVLLR